MVRQAAEGKVLSDAVRRSVAGQVDVPESGRRQDDLFARTGSADLYQDMGWPIGSGVTEAACKTLVKQRLCRAGMRWTEDGAQTILSLRALLLPPPR